MNGQRTALSRNTGTRSTGTKKWIPVLLNAALLVALTYVVVMVLVLPRTVYKLEDGMSDSSSDSSAPTRRVKHKAHRTSSGKQSTKRGGGNASSWSTVARIAEEINSDPVLLSLPPLWGGARGTIFLNSSSPLPVEHRNLLLWANGLISSPAVVDKGLFEQLERAAREAADKSLLAKGRLVKYGNVYGSLTTRGAYYAYNHSGRIQPCSLHRISLKFDSDCGDGDLAPKDVRKLLVVAVQRSGTHYTWEMLNRLGVNVHHEGVGPAGAVSWFFAVNARVAPSAKTSRALLTALPYPINNPVRLAKQVRHPLRVINTLVSRCRAWDKYWYFISAVYGMGDVSAAQSPLQRAMLLYVLWNRHIERYADIRFRGEATSPRDVCAWARFRGELCRSNGEFSSANGSIVEPGVGEGAEVGGVLGEGGAEEGGALVGSSVRDAEADAYLASEEERRRVALERATSRGLRLRKAHPHPTRSPSHTHKHKRSRGIDKSLPPTTAPTPVPALVITWDAVLREDAALGAELMAMCLEYGYPLDPEQLPQSEQSRLFAA